MAKIAFNMKYRQEIESGKYKVVTKDGFTVLIKACAENPILLVALVGKDKGPVDCIKCDDIRILDGISDNTSDLFILTDETELKDIELNEFEKALDYYNILSDYDYASMDGIEIKHKIRNIANKLLDIARKQILSEMPHWRHIGADTGDSCDCDKKIDMNGALQERANQFSPTNKDKRVAYYNGAKEVLAAFEFACMTEESIEGKYYNMLSVMGRLNGWKEDWYKH